MSLWSLLFGSPRRRRRKKRKKAPARSRGPKQPLERIPSRYRFGKATRVNVKTFRRRYGLDKPRRR